MDDKKMLNDEELEEVAGGVTSDNAGLKVSFEIECSDTLFYDIEKKLGFY